MAAIALTAAAPATAPWFRHLLVAAAALALVVVGLGAYVRLSDAGLGCPDWPGCYGHWIGVPDAAHELARAEQAFPGQPVHAGKAWKEMAHRYAAGTLGLLVLAIALVAFRHRRRIASTENALLALIALQAALGMWTVTLLLKPVIVTLHLLGGMATWATLVLLLRRDAHPARATRAPLGRIAVAVVLAQIALGGWVSSNYAALACSDFPACRDGQWWPAPDFAQGFALLHDLAAAGGDGTGSLAALTAVHLLHRLGALVVAGVVGAHGLRCWRRGQGGGLILAALALQIALGLGNVLLQLPLPVAVGHNLGAALLLGVLVWTSQAQPMARRPAG
jgi:cytochrome c oxidase assembly protein subunit 15